MYVPWYLEKIEKSSQFIKKVTKQVINNYRPVSLLSICGKTFERTIFKSLYEYDEEKKLLLTDCMFLSCHVRVSEWIHTL